MKETRKYKQTELGLLPEDWDVAKLGEKVSDSCYGIGAEAISYNGVDKYLRITDITDEGHFAPNPLCSPAFFNESYIATENDLFVARTGASVGKTYLYDSKDGRLIFAGFLMKLNITDANSKFVFYYTQTSQYKNWVISESMRSGQPGLNLKQIKNLSIPLPTIEEQRRIASALTSIDNLIDSLDRLIAKKRDIKQGAMLQLLSGKKRLKGFTEPWVEKKLGDIGYFLKGSGISKSQANSGTLCAVRYGELYTLHHNYIKTYNSHISKDVAQFATKIQKGDILFACSGETKEEIGKCAAFVDDVEAYAGGDILILRTDQEQCSDIFLGFLLNMPIAANQKAAKGQGDAVVHISKEALSNINSLFPSKEEQQAIASVLTSMDNELSALETKRKKYEQIKQGMMQQLLTGRIRLAQ